MDYDEEHDEEPYRGPWSVAIFLVDRAYGGPEEGGWYYDCGYPVFCITDEIKVFDQVRIFETLDEARKWRDQLQDILDATVNVGRRDIDSVLSEGRYEAHISDGFPSHFPKQRPRYE